MMVTDLLQFLFHFILDVTSRILLFCSTASPCISQVDCSVVISRASDAVLCHVPYPYDSSRPAL